MKKKVWRMLEGTLAFISIAAFVPPAQSTSSDSRIEPALQEARQMADDLADRVRGVLFKELKKGGFPEAVRACSELAQEITRSFNARPGHSIRRVSLRYRNVKDIPDEFEQSRLKEFDRLNKQKNLPKEFFEVRKQNDGETLRYLKPLVAIPLCLNCHGSGDQIPAAVKAILKEKYPQDLAIGYRAGDVRGAISVQIVLATQ